MAKKQKTTLNAIIKPNKNGGVYKGFFKTENGKKKRISEKEYLKDKGFKTEKLSNEKILKSFQSSHFTEKEIFADLKKSKDLKSKKVLEKFEELNNGITVYKSKNGFEFRQKGKKVSNEVVMQTLDLPTNSMPLLFDAVSKRGFSFNEASKILENDFSASYTFNQIAENVKSTDNLYINGKKYTRGGFLNKLLKFETKMSEVAYMIKFKATLTNKGIEINIPTGDTLSELLEAGTKGSESDEFDNFYILKS